MVLGKLEFRRLDLEGLKTLVNWAKLEGWNPGPFDAEVFMETDPDGFFGFYLNNSMVAGGAIISYNGDFGFMGLFIVKPEHRGNGIGRKLWYLRRDKLIDRLKGNAPIGMDGVVGMQSFYQKGGFKIAFKDERYEKMGIALAVSNNIAPVENKDFNEITDYDRNYFGFSRPQFLKPWLNLPGNKKYKYIDNNNIKGYVVLRKASLGHKIGPLFADNDKIAEELYRACLNAVVGEPVYFDIPLINSGAVKIVKKYKARYVFECARMYYGNPPKVDMNKVYGITTFELG